MNAVVQTRAVAEQTIDDPLWWAKALKTARATLTALE
jgi:hypothetical protein